MHKLNSKRQRMLILAILLAVSVLMFTGCSMIGKVFGINPAPNNSEEKPQKPPKQLEELDRTLENVFNTLGGPSAVTPKKQEQIQSQNQSSQSQQGSQSQGNQQAQGNGQSQSNGQSQGNQQAQNEKSQGQPQQEPWAKLSEDIKSLHTGWNEFMPQIAKMGASQELLEGFSNALNHLTETAKTKDKNQTLLAANMLYASIPDLYSLYQIKTVPGLKMMVYQTRKVILTSLTPNWQETAAAMEELKTTCTLIRPTLEGQEDQMIKLDLSVNELEKVVQKQNSDLVQIKGKLILSNLEALQKSL